jgi:uncharacterized protein (DUF1778 family)
MGSITQAQSERINLRLKHNAKLMLERAASFEGVTVSKFIISCALDHAEKTIKENDLMSLNASDSELFFNALSAPVEFNSKLQSAFKEHDQRIVSK